MLLAIDMGNTNICIGVFNGDHLLESWRLSTDKKKTADEYRLLISQLLYHAKLDMNKINGIAISCVVPPVLPQFWEMSIKGFNIEPVVLDSSLDTGMPILYDNPKEVGADRIADSVAGYVEYGGPLIIIDFGTATTFDVVSVNGEYLGGAIAPGISLSSEALSERAAMLPKIDIKEAPRAIGKNTIAGMQSGLYFGFMGQMEEIIRQIKKELPQNPKVIATGGLAPLIAGKSKLVDLIDPDLTLKGLKIIFDRVSKGSK
ncbi:type III pantothenate kinase [Candidatus Poribacteria bacterium]|nr:type III pantothenate kinase [Candidatus Poribacteria bacterium]